MATNNCLTKSDFRTSTENNPYEPYIPDDNNEE